MCKDKHTITKEMHNIQIPVSFIQNYLHYIGYLTTIHAKIVFLQCKLTAN